jgi:hypothetical protein
MMPQGVEQGPEVLPFHLLGVNREPGHLECFKVPVQRPGMAFELLREVSRRLPPPGGYKGLGDLPLPCQLIAPRHSTPLAQVF